MASTTLRPPAISHVELQSFHDAHFGPASISHFSTNFVPPHDAHDGERSSQFQHPEEVYDHQETEPEDDGLGYYEDGVKRTLTDEQIAIFRHSELEAMRRGQESRDPGRATSNVAATTTTTSQPIEAGEPGELPSEDDAPSEAVKRAGKKKKKKQRRRTKARVEPEKPDLRKRTWDVVDSGLASLNYGDEPQHACAVPRPNQRRHISYDD